MNKLQMIISALQNQRNNKKHVSFIFREYEKLAKRASHIHGRRQLEMLAFLFDLCLLRKLHTVCV